MATQVVRRRARLDLPDEGMQALDELGCHDVLPGDEDVVQPTPGQQGDVVGRVAQLDLSDELVQGGDVGDVTEELQLFFRQLGHFFGFLRSDGGEGADVVAVDVLGDVRSGGGKDDAAAVDVEGVVDGLAVFTFALEGFYCMHRALCLVVFQSLFHRHSTVFQCLSECLDGKIFYCNFTSN